MAGSSSGTVKSSVSNVATKKVLERAVVSVEGTGHVALTDREGRFSLVGLPTGPCTLVVTYAGLDDLRKTIVVAAGETATIDFDIQQPISYPA